MRLGLENHSEVLNKITDVAINEFTLETALDKMYSDLRSYSFEMVPYKSTDAFLVANTEDLTAMLDDQLVMLQTMLSSPYILTFMQRARNWKQTIKSVQELLDEWLLCQQRWVYLAPIFSSEDINRQLPVEGRKYTAVDSAWKKVMAQIKQNSKVLIVTGQEKLIKQFGDCNKLLEVIIKGLTEYLEKKRSAFSRFYFLSNEELLDILSKAKGNLRKYILTNIPLDATAVRPHLRKCFENLVALKFSSNMEIKTIFSAEGEKVNLSEPVPTTGKDVERWLLDLEGAMRKTLKKLLARAIIAHSKMSRENWIFSWPGQLVLAANQIVFTQWMSKALQGKDATELVAMKRK
jgi:dynein heavy chain